MLRQSSFIIECCIARFLCAMHVFEVRASCYLCAKFHFFRGLICWASSWRKMAYRYSITQSLTQLIWCPGNRSLRFGTTNHNWIRDADTCAVQARMLLLGRVALRAQRPIVIKLCRRRSVGLCVGRRVGLSSALWKNGGSTTYAAATSIFTTGLRLDLAMCAGLAHSVARSWCSVINTPSSGDHFRRRYQIAPWETFAATRPFSQITLGRLVSSSSTVVPQSQDY